MGERGLQPHCSYCHVSYVPSCFRLAENSSSEQNVPVVIRAGPGVTTAGFPQDQGTLGKCQGIKKVSGKSGKMGVFPGMSGKNDLETKFTKSFFC